MDRLRSLRLRARRAGVRVGAVVAAAVLALAGVAVTVAALSDGDEDTALVTEEPQQVRVGEETDGGVISLDVSVFTPPEGAADASAGGRRAALVLAHGFGGDKTDLEGQARELATRGYVVLTYTARGFGASGGRIHLNAPTREIADVSALLDLLAERDDVRLDADGDPRVGVAGASYGGASSLMAAGYDDRVDAVVSGLTWHDLGQSLFPQSAYRNSPPSSPAAAQPIGTAGVFKQQWAAQFFASGLAGGPGAGSAGGGDSERPTEVTECGRFAPDICSLYGDAATTGRPGPGALDRLRRSSPATVLDQIEAPTLLVQGQQDSLFDLAAADANARGIAADGTPVGMRWIDGGHDEGPSADDDSPDEMTGEMSTWFDHHLRDGPEPDSGFEFTLPAGPANGAETEQLAAPSYLTREASEEHRVPVYGDVQRLLGPPGGQPSAVTSVPGLGGLEGVGDVGDALPGQTATFRTSPFDEGHRVVGSPRVRLTVTSTTTDATLFASLRVVAPDGSATLPRSLVSPIRVTGLTPGEPEEVEVALPASAYEVEKGERLRLVVSSTDAAYAVPEEARTYQVGLADEGELSLPGVDAEPVAGDPVVPVRLAGVVAAVVVAAPLLGLLLSRRRRGTTVPALDDVPLVVESLVKEYPDGLRAVDDVSWRAERGRVVGLLGPNGAGKTTTMRMLMGLIHPDGGRALVLGDEVRAGAPVLARVGALIEGPGFLPHLTGRDNLTAYWAATGRPEAEASFDEVLDIAGLGAAVDRPVRSYSHGMRQRLGIAQAMLGLPELLLLDEPTNGLDPPQIRAFRDVLAEYAAGGRTVVVSSHLLAEVEQTCSHVVVMDRGRVVLTGAVEDLLPRTGSILVSIRRPTTDAGPGVDVAERAAASLRRTKGVTEVEVDAAGRVRVRGDVDAADVVRILVEGDFAVTSVDSRRHLEDVFMSLVGEQAVTR